MASGGEGKPHPKKKKAKGEVNNTGGFSGFVGGGGGGGGREVEGIL